MWASCSSWASAEPTARTRCSASSSPSARRSPARRSIRIIWGAHGYTITVPALLQGPFQLGFLFYSKYRIFVACMAVVLLIGVWWFLERTPYGAVIKAGAHDPEMVRALGINLRKLRHLVFGLGAVLAGLAGVIAAPMWSLKPMIGSEALMPALIITVIGGIGSFSRRRHRRAVGGHHQLAHESRTAAGLDPSDVPAHDRHPALPAARPHGQKIDARDLRHERPLALDAAAHARDVRDLPGRASGAARARLHVSRHGDHDLVGLRARLQSAALLYGSCRLRARRLLRHGQLLFSA